MRRMHDLDWGIAVLGVILLAALFLGGTGCGDYSGFSGAGENVQETINDTPPPPGPNPDAVDSVVAFESTVYPLLTDYCSDCHAGPGPGFPDIASADLATAHSEVVSTQKVNLLNPSGSRLAMRLDPEQHHCWTASCADDAMEMEAAILEWATLVDAAGGGTVVGEAIESQGLAFTDGLEDIGSERVSQNMIAFYEFKEGSGATAYDTSGVEPAMDLQLEGVDWMSSYGIQIVGEDGRAQASRDASRKLYDRIAEPNAGSQQYTIEAWVVPANTAQEGPARIVSYSNGTGARNFTMGQTLYNYVFRNRSMAPEVGDNGTPELQTYDDDQDLQATLQHAVMTFDQYQGRRIYVNGVFTDDVDEQGPGRLWTWADNHRFILGNETSLNRLWLGQIRLVAIYENALTEDEIRQNFNAGVGKRLLMRFDVSQYIGGGSFVEFVVSELDDFSYLFCEPTVVTGQTNVRVSGIRIAVNGQVPVAGQAFTNLDQLVTEDRQRVSPQCALVAKDGGPNADMFHLEFDRLGQFENVIADDPPPPPPPTFEFVADLPTLGLRNFARVNETMSAVTGIDANMPSVRDTFDELEQQLPPTADLRAFASSHQVAISKLALEYCDGLVENAGLRAGYFPGFDFNAPATTAFATPAQRDLVFEPLIEEMIGVGIASEPDMNDVKTVLDTMVDSLTAGCTPATCPAERTRTVVKSACAAVLASGAVSIH